jgi:hypothetical protein
MKYFNTLLYKTKMLTSMALLSVMLNACGGSTGAVKVQTTPLPPPTDQSADNYSGPPATTTDVSEFKLNLWDNLVSTQRCGACHTEGSQSPYFVRDDDINLAYTAANPLVNLSKPEDSRLVTKVTGGHNCWLSSPDACADIMTTWISNWANNEAQANQIQLQVPVVKAPASNKNFPLDNTLFVVNVYPSLQTYCANCHSNSATIPISPYFGSGDEEEAYQAAKDKMNLDNPANSRFVIRLRDEFHNCWSDCTSNAADLISAIGQMADGIQLTELDDALVSSKALNLFDGTLATGGGRFEQDLIAKWEFKTGSGATAFDTSGVEPAINLNISGGVSWLAGWGLQFTNGKAQGSTTSSKKLHDLLNATGEYAIEAWLVPANVSQEGPARIISYSGGSTTRNFTLGQTLYNYDYLLRTRNTDTNGEPALSTSDADEDLQASLQHVVVNYDGINGRQIFVNGQATGDVDTIEAGDLGDWNDTYAFVLGNEVSGDIPWAGAIRMVAIHNRVLNPAQIAQNFDVGIGQKFFLLFAIGDIINLPQSYVVLEVSLFDNYSYLFSEPFFINLDANAVIGDTPLKGMRIGLNGREINVAQVYKNLDLSLNASDYLSGQGQTLSRLGTVIPVEKGPAIDEFFLTFEQLGQQTNVVVEADPPLPAQPADLPGQAVIGLRDFAEINASMAAVTTVPTSNNAVKAAFETLKQQLPAVTNMGGFLASNQMAVTQMAIKYCDQLVESPSLRSAYFSDFDFNQPATSAFTTANRERVINPLLDRVIGINIAAQPERSATATELNALVDTLTDCSAGKVCDANYTRTIVKATCAATLGSAALLLQ